jgi:hypothetical protein
MSRSDIDLQKVARELDRCETIQVEMTAELTFGLVAFLQLACRHPGTLGMATTKEMKVLAVALQDLIWKRCPEAGRALEQGWHELYDVDAERVNLAEECRKPGKEEPHDDDC